MKVNLPAPAGYTAHRHTQWVSLSYTVNRVTPGPANPNTTVGYVSKRRVPKRTGRGSCQRWFYQPVAPPDVQDSPWVGPFQTASSALQELVDLLEGRRSHAQ